MLFVTAQARDFWVYFGTYTNELSHGIYVSRLDAKTGRLAEPQLAAEVGNPNFLNFSPDGKHLYSSDSTHESGEDGDGMVNSFAVDAHTGTLTPLNHQPSGGYDPCYVSVANDGHGLLIANYDNGAVKTLPIKPDGSLDSAGAITLTSGHSVNRSRQTGPHAHYIAADPSGHFVLECDLGTDKVVVFKLNSDGTLSPAATPFATVPPGSGCRHLAFSPNGKFVHVINEMGCTVTTFSWDAQAGELKSIETVSALPPGVKVDPGFTGAEILAVGRHVYATVRGHDSVTVFKADKTTGRLTFQQNISSGGKVPRGLGIDPTGHWLFTGNQKTGNAVEFSISSWTGKISPTGRELKIGSPVDVKFIEVQ